MFQALDKNLAEVSVVRDISVDPEMAVVDEEGKARASLLILLNQEERNGIKLRLRSNKMASDLSEERSKRLKLQKALLAAQRQQGRVESQTRVEELQGAVDHLNERFLAQTAKNQTLSSKMHFLQVRADRLASELTEKQQQYFLLEARQVDSEKLLSESQARVDELQSVIDEQNRKLQRQTAEKQTFSFQMKSVLEENSAKDALLASLNSRANKLICDIAEEKDKSLDAEGACSLIIKPTSNVVLIPVEKETIIVPRKKMEAGNRGRPSILQPVCPAPSEPSPVSGLPSADKATLPADNHVPEEEEAFKCRPCDNNNDNQVRT